MEKNNLKKLRLYSFSALFASMIFVATAYLPRLQIGSGYVHLGDTMIFIAASMLPAPFAFAASVIGASLADLLTGFAVWVPATFIIKGATALCFTDKSKKIISRRNLFALICAAFLCSGGYYLYEALIYGNFLSPIAYIIPNLLQSSVSAVLYLLLAALFDKAPQIKNLFKNDK